jgi:hypothetical protein
MPVHDWTRVPADVFFHFRLCWLVDLRLRVSQILPPDWCALMVPDAFDPDADPVPPVRGRRAVAVFDKAARRTAVIDVPPPDAKDRAAEVERYARKVAGQLERGVNVLVVDVYPQVGNGSRRVADAIWNVVSSAEFNLPPERPLTVAAFATGRQNRAFVEPLSPGDTLPDMPLFIGPDLFVPAPLEASYVHAFDGVPRHFRAMITARREGGPADGT